MSNSITLSDQSIAEIQVLCQAILRKQPNNSISVKLAKGISDFAATKRYVSEKQANWLAQNLDRNRMTRPPELANIVVEQKNKKTDEPKQLPLPLASESSSNDPLLAVLLRIEGLMKTHAAKYN